MTEPSSEGRSDVLKILTENLTASAKVAHRLLWSCEKVSYLLPLDADKVDNLTNEQEESLDALLQRFNSLTAMDQDHITRGILTLEEENVVEKTQRARRELMERLGALRPELRFGTLVELRNRIAHFYPDEAEKQAQILNEVHKRSRDLIEAYNEAMVYADKRYFGSQLDLHSIPVTMSSWGRRRRSVRLCQEPSTPDRGWMLLLRGKSHDDLRESPPERGRNQEGRRPRHRRRDEGIVIETFGPKAR